MAILHLLLKKGVKLLYIYFYIYIITVQEANKKLTKLSFQTEESEKKRGRISGGKRRRAHEFLFYFLLLNTALLESLYGTLPPIDSIGVNYNEN